MKEPITNVKDTEEGNIVWKNENVSTSYYSTNFKHSQVYQYNIIIQRYWLCP